MMTINEIKIATATMFTTKLILLNKDFVFLHPIIAKIIPGTERNPKAIRK